MNPPVPSADVEADAAGGVDGEVIERRGELATGARDERLARAFDLEPRVDRHRRAGLVDALPVDLDAARHHRALRLLATLEQSALDQQQVEPHLLGRVRALVLGAHRHGHRSRSPS